MAASRTSSSTSSGMERCGAAKTTVGTGRCDRGEAGRGWVINAVGASAREWDHANIKWIKNKIPKNNLIVQPGITITN